LEILIIVLCLLFLASAPFRFALQVGFFMLIMSAATVLIGAGMVFFTFCIALRLAGSLLLGTRGRRPQ
jgi:hypothetical protein